MNTDKGVALFDVVITNEILGNSFHTMSMGAITKFNYCALMML